MNFRRRLRTKTDKLPIDVTMKLSSLPPVEDTRVTLHRAGSLEPGICLDEVIRQGCELTVHVPASYACAGAGVHTMQVFDGCVAVCEMEVELSALCTLEGATHKAVKSADCC